MEENKPGKRLAEDSGMSPAAKRGLIIALAVVAALCAAYVALCAWVGAGGSILPRTTALGVDLGGLTAGQAEERLNIALAERYRDRSVTFTLGEGGESFSVPGEAVSADAAAAAQQAWAWGHEQSFLLRGGCFLASLAAGHEVDAPLAFSETFEIDKYLSDIESGLNGQVKETTWSQSGEYLLFRMGTPGVGFDKAAAKQAILDQFAREDYAPFVVSTAVTDPAFPDLEAIHAAVYAEVRDATLDPETFEITPSVTGYDFDMDKARALLTESYWNSSVSIPLVVTQPNVSTESLRELLFRDVLGEAASKVSGSASRKSNVALAASTYNERILLPGEVFSYNDTTGSRTADKGYKAAPVYKGGKSVDEVGGGICQPSSTLYYAVLNANLKIVERHNHQFAVGYVPDGMDATVYFGSLDFKFENSTDYPIKIVETYENSRLTVQIYGTKTDATTVKMTNEVYEWIPYTTVYKVDPNMAPGSAPKEEQNGYNGRRAKTYRNVYDENGNLVSSTLETTNKYAVRERILLVSPADAAQYGLSADGTPLPSTPVTPVPETPAVTPEPTASAGEAPETPAVPGGSEVPPAETAPGAGSETVPPLESPPPTGTVPPPVESQIPAESQAPIETQPSTGPQAPVESQAPAEETNTPPPGIPIDPPAGAAEA